MPTTKTINIRQLKEQKETENLSQFAAKSALSRGRAKNEDECPLRTKFQRDRDRILHSKSFRRLKHKTQVFIAPDNDHFRTRLTHTLEVSQISRTLASALNLNEDLTEAIALGHDLGHTPFGHRGEQILSTLLSPESFHHNVQSVRIVTEIEQLNLTFETLDGILNHTGGQSPFTMEGQIVKIADRVAYINHDIEDALQAGLITPNRLPQDCLAYLGNTKSERITKLVCDIINSSQNRSEIRMSEPCTEYMNRLRTFLFENVYLIENFNDKINVENVITRLFEYYKDFFEKNFAFAPENAIMVTVSDLISSMSDLYALKKYEAVSAGKYDEHDNKFLEYLLKINRVV